MPQESEKGQRKIKQILKTKFLISTTKQKYRDKRQT